MKQKRHTPEEIIKSLREAEEMTAAGKRSRWVRAGRRRERGQLPAMEESIWRD
jgi:hypothetical protein